MGRMRKQTAEYFPHFARGGRTLFILEKRWGNDGYAFWFKLLELLCNCDGHYYDCSKVTDIEYLASNASVSAEVATEILDMLAEMENIDKPLWEQKKIIWCQALVDNLASLYSKRTTDLPKKPLLDGEEPPAPPEPSQKPPDEPKPNEVKKNKGGRKTAATKPPKPEKKHYAEFVTMTEAEYQKLVEAHGEEKTKLFIQCLDNYKGSSGKKYASDYRTILNWVIDRVNEDLAKKGGTGHGTDAHFGGNQPAAFKPSGGFRSEEN